MYHVQHLLRVARLNPGLPFHSIFIKIIHMEQSLIDIPFHLHYVFVDLKELIFYLCNNWSNSIDALTLQPQNIVNYVAARFPVTLIMHIMYRKLCTTTNAFVGGLQGLELGWARIGFRLILSCYSLGFYSVIP